MNILSKIQQLRKKGLTYRQIGQKPKISRQYAWYVLNGKKGIVPKNCQWCFDKMTDPKYYVRRWGEKKGFMVDEGCMLSLDGKGIIDPSFTGIVK